MVGHPVIRDDGETQPKYSQPRRGGDDRRGQKRLVDRRWLDVENQEGQSDGEDAVADGDDATRVFRERTLLDSLDVVSSCFVRGHDEMRIVRHTLFESQSF